MPSGPTPSAGTPDDVRKARDLNRRLRDIDKHFAQYVHLHVASQDGNLYLARAALLPNITDVEPYPRLDPKRRVGERPDKFLDIDNAARLRRLDSSLAAFTRQTLQDSAGTHVFARANRVAHRKAHDLQVVWNGQRRSWTVLEGGVRWREYDDFTGETETKSTYFKAREFTGNDRGWIVMPINVGVLGYDSRLPHLTGQTGYVLDVEAPRFTEAPANDPPRRTLASGEIVPPGGIYWDTITWTDGRFDLPIAYVEAPSPSHRVPRIDQIATGSWDISSLDGIAAWSGTLPRATFTTLPAPDA